MPKYLVEWSILGSSIVEAENEKEAKQKVENMDNEALYADVDGFEISDVEHKDQNVEGE